MKYIDFQEAKRVPIEDILLNQNVRPKLRTSKELWYVSPLRSEKTASFHVRIRENTWKDFGDPTSGTDNIDLVMHLGLADTPYDAAKWITERFLSNSIEHTRIPVRVTQNAVKNPEEKTVITRVVDVHHPALIRYFCSRGIPYAILSKYCKEVHYKRSDGRRYFGVGFANMSGGYSLRSEYFKGCVGRNDISVRPGKNRTECIVYEGFSDMLAYETLNGEIESDIVVLNSVALVNRAIPMLRPYDIVLCALDTDEAGREYTKMIMTQIGTRAVDLSGEYRGYKDYNDYLLGKQKSVAADATKQLSTIKL